MIHELKRGERMSREKQNLGEFKFYVMLAVVRLGDGA